jgi:hypothetical protein
MPDGTVMAVPADSQATKACAVCGRAMTYRRRWSRAWATVKYCSDRCRRQGLGPADARAEAAIRVLLAARARGASICPGEAARVLAAERGAAGDWRADLPGVRRAANRLVAAGALEMTQQGRVVDPARARGPVRLRWPASAGG